jgi:inner membrane protein
MMTLSHIFISSLATAAITGSSDPIAIGIGGIAGLLPDVDGAKSPAGRILFPVSKYLEKHFPHRSFTHSILASIALSAICYGFSYAGWLSIAHSHAIIIGYTAGYLADLVTKSGIQMLYPASLRCVVPGNRNLRLSTGSNAEYAILTIVLGILILVLNINTRGGMTSTLNEMLGTPRGVAELMNKKGNSQIIVMVEGARTFDRSRVHDRFAVLDQKDRNTFIVHPLDRPQDLYQVSNKPDGSQIYAERITAHEGQKIKIQSQFIRFNDEEIAPKLLSISQTAGAQIYLSGAIEIEDGADLTIDINPDRYPVIVKRGSKLELDRCPLETFTNLIGDTWGTGQIAVKAIYTFGNT